MSIWGRWQSKPPPGTAIDWSHPLAQGLANLWVFNEGTGYPVDLVSQRTMALGFGTTAPSWVSCASGWGFSPADNTYFQSPGPTNFQQFTLVFVGNTFTATSSTFNRIINTDGVTANGVSLCVNIESYGGAGSLEYLRGNSGWVSPSAQMAVPTNVPVCLGISTNIVAGVNVNFFMRRYDTNAASYGTATGSPAIIPGSGQASINGQSGATANGGTSTFVLGLISSMAWTPAQLASFADNPWQIFQPPRSRFLFKSGGAAIPFPVPIYQIMNSGRLTGV